MLHSIDKCDPSSDKNAVSEDMFASIEQELKDERLIDEEAQEVTPRK